MTAGAQAGDCRGAADTARLTGGDCTQTRHWHRVAVFLAALFPRRTAGAAPIFTRAELPDASTSGLATPIFPAANATGLMEITLPGRASVRVDAKEDERALRRVLRVLREG